MKRILITGADSYIGMSFENWVKKTEREFVIDTIEVISDKWKEKDFSVYDVIFHVAAIVHVKEQDESLYQKINCDLAYNIALKARQDGVKQFIFLSTLAIFGADEAVLTERSTAHPQTPYAKSKFAAEKKLHELKSDNFKVAILRPPFVYGRGCKGNYVRLRKLALMCPVFPKVKNERSMLYIDNLSEFLCICILNEDDGLFHPQNNEYVCTSDMVQRIRSANGKKTYLVPGFAWLMDLLRKSNTINKVFGNLKYSKTLSEYKVAYALVGFEESVMATEGKIYDKG